MPCAAVMNMKGIAVNRVIPARTAMVPTVSVIIPCRNEEATIRLLLEALLKQTYPLPQMEVIIADGMSTDRTREVIKSFALEHPELSVKIVDNPKQIIPAALNTAIAAARGVFLVRMDAHSIPRRDYVQHSAALLEAGKAENVGGVWDVTPQGDHWIARSIAASAAHPLAVGGAQYRFSKKAEYVDTVPFGAFPRSLIDEIGGFDETLLSNEDYEFNTRIRKSGGRIWLDPQIRSIYFARKNLKELAKQYWRYGFWKSQMLKRYPETLRYRQAIPPLFVAGILILFLAGLIYRPFLRFFVLAVGLYLLTLLAIGIQLAILKKDILLIIGAPLATMTMHFAWGAGFIVGLFSRTER